MISRDSFEGIFHEMVEHAEDVVLLVDREFKIRYASTATERKFKREPISLLGKNVFDFIRADRRKDWKANLANNKEIFTEDIKLEIQGQTVFFEVNVLYLRNGIGWMFKLHDITARKIQERSLIGRNEQLDHIIYKTIHDLKAPVSSMMGLVDLVSRTEDAEEKKQYFSLIERSLIKMSGFIDEMGNFFKNEKFSVQRAQVNLRDLIVTEIENLKNSDVARNISFVIDVEESVAFYSDEIRIKTVVTNIVSNAIKYSDLSKANPTVKIKGFVDEDFAVIRFEDNGIGIAPEHNAKIYNMFYRATSHQDGSGLGLFIVKDTVDKLNGSIEMTSTFGLGTTFEIQIPNQVLQPDTVE